jgi:hypothetical protein
MLKYAILATRALATSTTNAIPRIAVHPALLLLFASLPLAYAADDTSDRKFKFPTFSGERDAWFVFTIAFPAYLCIKHNDLVRVLRDLTYVRRCPHWPRTRATLRPSPPRRTSSLSGIRRRDSTLEYCSKPYLNLT